MATRRDQRRRCRSRGWGCRLIAVEPGVRSASVDDAAACAELCAPYVLDTVVTFETESPTREQMAERIATTLRSHAWPVLEDCGRTRDQPDVRRPMPVIDHGCR
jgi:tRNA(Ile)-lysidine synthase TilS/MesJ